MSIVAYIVGTGSNWQNNELRYSLRSVEKFLNPEAVYIVGHKPDFVQNVIHIPAEDETNYKETNIYRKVVKACERIGEPFLWMHDDHFLVDKPKIGFFCNSTIEGKIPYYGNSYKISLGNTLRALKSRGKKTMYYDIHCPISVNPVFFISAMQQYDWKIKRGYCVKSLYLNTIDVPFREKPDAKIRTGGTKEQLKERIKGMDVFSISDQTICPGLLELMNELYPNKSKYEITK